METEPNQAERTQSEPDRLLTATEVMALVGLRRTALYAAIRRGDLPRPVRLGPQAVRWRSTELREALDRLPRAVSQYG